MLVDECRTTQFCVTPTSRHISLDLWSLYADETNPLLRERFFARVTEMYGYPVRLAILMAYILAADASINVIRNQSYPFSWRARDHAQVLGEEKAEGKHLRSVLESVLSKPPRSLRFLACAYV